MDYTYERHVGWNEDLLWNHLDLKNITIVLQDWGGIQGLRVAARSPNRFSRLLLTNTVFPTCDVDFEGQNYITKGFYAWKDFVHSGGLKGPNKVGKLLRRAARGPSCGPSGKISKEEEASYQAPFPHESYLAGVIQYPELVPTPPHDPTGRPQPIGGDTNRALWPVFENWTKPVLLAFSDADPVLGGAAYLFKNKCPGTKNQPHITLEDAGHFSQDGGGHQLVEALINFVETRPVNNSRL